MRKVIIYLFIIIFFIGCDGRNSESFSELKNVCDEYIEFLISERINKDKVLISVYEEQSSDGKVSAYRISAGRQYLYEESVPNEVYNYKEFTVLLYMKKDVLDVEKEKIRENLKSKGFYDKHSYSINTNYWEWVLLKKSDDLTFRLIKDTWYKPLDELIKQ